MHAVDLKDLVLVPKALKSFTYEVADCFSLNDPWISYFQPAWISPSRILQTLEPHQEALENISIRSVQSNSMDTLVHACQMSPSVDEGDSDEGDLFLRHAHHLLPPISLSSFPHLLYASVYITDLLGIPYSPFRRLTELLPSSLQRIALRYDPLVPLGYERSSFSEPFTHLLDLFADKASGKALPDLNEIEINLRKSWYIDLGLLDRLVDEAQSSAIKLTRSWHDDVDYDPRISGAITSQQDPEWDLG